MCQEPREFNLFLQTQLKWNQRKSVKTNDLFPSKDELVDVFLKGKNQKLARKTFNNLLKSHQTAIRKQQYNLQKIILVQSFNNSLERNLNESEHLSNLLAHGRATTCSKGYNSGSDGDIKFKFCLFCS